MGLFWKKIYVVFFGYLKALVWFWIIDKTYALTFVMSCDMSYVGAIQVRSMVALKW